MADGGADKIKVDPVESGEKVRQSVWAWGKTKCRGSVASPRYPDGFSSSN